MSTWNDARNYVQELNTSNAPSVQSDVRSLLSICDELQRLGNSPTNFLRTHLSTLRRTIPVLWPLIAAGNIAAIERVLLNSSTQPVLEFIRTYGLREYEEVEVRDRGENITIEMTPAQFYRIRRQLASIFDLRTA